MDFTIYIPLLFATLVLIGIGLLLNTFIVTANFIWWRKSGAIQTVDVIITSLGTVRILFLITYVPALSSITESFLADNISFTCIMTITTCVQFCSLWWGTVLCVFYCVKITTYSNIWFMRLKMNICRWVPWLLLKTMLVSVLSSLPCLWFLHSVHDTDSSQVINGTDDGNITLETNYINLMIINAAGSFIPFLIFCASIGLLIVSLLKHTENMSSKDSGFTKSQLVAHRRVIKNMASFLLFYALFFISSILMPLSLHVEYLTFRRLCRIGSVLYPSLHSVMLIASNGNLKRSFLTALCWPRKRNPK